MRHVVGKKVIPAREEDDIVVECDLGCGRRGTPGTFCSVSWNDDNHAIEETSITFREGTTYPEGGNDETVSAEICPECMKTKVFPWLESQGVKLRRKELDW